MMELCAYKVKCQSVFIENKQTLVTRIGQKRTGGDEYENIIEGSWIKIFSYSKGKGFSGVIKRHGFHSNNKTHGNSKAHNKPGSIGMCQDPGKVFRGKRMAGRKGGCLVRIRRKVYKVSKEGGLWVYGNIPGANGSKIVLCNIEE